MKKQVEGVIRPIYPIIDIYIYYMLINPPPFYGGGGAINLIMNKATTTKPEKEIITAPKGTKYLSDIMQELPVNCLFNKGKTGCGGTELVLRGKKNAIIAVPYVNLILNKLDENSEHGDRRNEILGFYQEIEESEVIDYIKSHEVKKIIVTYDSLPRLMKIITGINGDERKGFEEYFLLVDEWHCLFKYYEFRKNAIRNLLVIARKFKEVTYMTATPIDERYTLEELRGYPVKEVQWEDKTNIEVNIWQSNMPISAFFKFADAMTKKYPEVNFHVFINSVSIIADIVKELSAPPEATKIVCSRKNEQNLKKLKKINPAYEIAFPDSPARKLNLYTSTAFEGCDIHDPDGINIIISSAHKEQTMLDIVTTVPQICGRIRDSKHKNRLFYFYSRKEASKITLEKYEETAWKDFNETEEFITDLNNLKPKNRAKVIKLLQERKGEGKVNPYIIEDEKGKISLDRNLVMFDIYNFYIINRVFTTRENIIKEFERNGNIVLGCKLSDYTRGASEALENNKDAKPSYKDLFEEYDSIRQNPFSLELAKDDSGQLTLREDSAKTTIERERPIIKEAYDELGIEFIRENQYDIKKIRKELVKRKKLPDIIKTIELLIPTIKFGQRYTLKELNDKLQGISQEYSLPKITASQLDDYFECENTSPKIEGKTTKCKIIYREKII